MNSKSRLFNAIIIFTLLTVVYTLFYSGTFVTDDEHILSSRALSFAFEGDFNISRVLGNSRIFEYSIIPEPWANQALNIEPTQAVAASLLALLAAFLNVGRIQLMFMLNIWVTAAAAVFVYLSTMKLGNSRKVSFFVTAFFGLGTISMPYSRTLFRDPLAMLLLAAAWYVAIVIRQSKLEVHNDKPRTAALWVLFLILFAAGVLSKNSVILALPVMLLEIALNRPSISKTEYKKWLIPMAIVLVLLLCWIFVIPTIPMLTRFSPNYYFSVIQKFISVQKYDLVQALLGPFFSPGKSIFIFSPILLLSLWGLFSHFRSSWSAWLYTLLLVVFQALFYGSEWAGHVNWGLRFVLPVIPLLTIAAAPVIGTILKKRGGTAFLVGFLALSVLIQILGSVTPVRQFYLDSLYSSSPVSEYATIWGAKTSILPWSVNWILSAHPLDLAIFRNPTLIYILVPSATLIVLLIILSLKIQKAEWISIAAGVMAVILGISMVSLYRYDSPYSLTRSDFNQSKNYLASQYQTGDLVLVKSYSENLWNYWMNWGSPSIPWTALPFSLPSPSQVADFKSSGNPELALDKITLWIFKNQLIAGRRVWLIGDETTSMASYDMDAEWLKMHLIGSDCLRFTGNQSSTRLCLFELTQK